MRLPGVSHEVRAERRHKCEDCGVSDLNLDPVVRGFKKESEKRSYDGIKKVLSEKRHLFEEKLTKKDDERDDSDDETGDEDDSDSVKASFERLEKFELKSKLDSKSRNKKASLIIDFSDDDDDDDDDSQVEDDDDYDLPIPSDHKKPVVEDSKKKIDDKQKSTASVKSISKHVTLSKDKKETAKEDEEKEGISGQIKPKLDLSTIKTTLKETLRPKEIEKTSKAPSQVEEKSKKQEDSKEVKEPDLPKIKVVSKLKDTLIKDSIVSEPTEKVIKTDDKEKEKSKQKIVQVEPVQKSKEKVVVEDVSKRKTVEETKKSVETTYDEKVVKKRETTKSESKDSGIQQVSEALHRRNLLHSEFEDFYAFFPTFAPNFSRVHNPECRRHGQILLRQLRGTKLWALNSEYIVVIFITSNTYRNCFGWSLKLEALVLQLFYPEMSKSSLYNN